MKKDALQEALLKLTKQRDRLSKYLSKSEPAAIESYFKVLAANAARDYFRSQRLSRVAPDEDPDENTEEFLDRIGVFTHPDVDKRILFQQIDSVLGDNRRDRTVFWLYYLQGFTAAEIAAIPAMGLSIKGVESVVHRLIKQVRTRLLQTGATSEKGIDELESS